MRRRQGTCCSPLLRRRLPALLMLALGAPCAHAQDSGIGTDLQFGDALDPRGLGTRHCDSDGASWLTAQGKRTPTGFLYACPPAEAYGGDASGVYSGRLSFGYLGLHGDENNMLWRRYSNWDDGLYLGAALRLEHPGDGSYVDLRASRLNGDSQYVRAVFGRAGKFRVQAFARSQANVVSGNARSIWDGVGGNHLTLKDGLVPGGSTPAQAAAVSAAQPERILKVVRDKQGVGLNYFINKRWAAFVNASHESRKGARPFGGPFFFNYPFADNGGVYEIPRPIDDSTVNLNGGARFVGNLWRMEFAYSGSFFRHGNRSFDYEVPFALSPVVPGLTAPRLTQGSFSYEPDNDYHHLRTSLSRKLAWGGTTGEFSLTASGGTMRQNDKLVAPMNCQGQFGINGIPGALLNCADWNTPAALSRRRADLSIDSQLLDARLVLQPSDRLTWRGNVKYQRNDYAGTYWAYNPLTGQWGYPSENGSQGSVVPGESGVWDPLTNPGAFTTIRNMPLDNELNEVSFGGDWRWNAKNTFGATYTFDRTERTHREVATTRDHALKLTWNNRALDWLTFRANYTYLRRTGSEYDYDPYEFTFSSQLPGYNGEETAHTVAQLRKYDVAGRVQNKIDLMATLTLPREMTLYASLRGDWNDYDALLGRQGYDTLGGSLQWEWQPSPATVASAWYGYDRSTLDFANVNDAAPGPDPNLGGSTYPEANRWWMRDRQRNHYAGASLSRRIGRVVLDADWNWTYSRGLTGYRYNSAGALVSPAVGAVPLDGEFPAMVYRTNTLTLALTFPIHRSLSMRLFDTYQRGSVFDWHYTSFEDGQVIDHRVYTDGGPTGYSVNMVGVLLEMQL
ncbi:MtrB/PioB family outer membrane beta-barrel protein [Luteimonas aquatica]|uniref:MtrB/PioB family outer membrane beta-barrel protein n=1 Tax=Luteimonas aquatica TaxID=450364 RepID=UPI001F5602BD|nr:MtrB/PioB family outer membrane beta-barrel protein [Luteimonas aquatica]